MTIQTYNFDIQGMHCEGCETTIEDAVESLYGVKNVVADFKHDSAIVKLDDERTSIVEIIECIGKAGYVARLQSTKSRNDPKTGQRRQQILNLLIKTVVNLVLLAGIGFIFWIDRWLTDYLEMPRLSKDVGYSLLALVGFLTSFHCIGMCGPFIVGYSANAANKRHLSHWVHISYSIGKTLSYTVLGAVFGAFGAFISITPFIQGIVGIAAGIFLVLYGLHMLEWFPFLSHFQIMLPPSLRRLIGHEARKHSNPFAIGLLNGLMIICGPLQAMYIMAAGSGNWLEGAKILFFFGLGTLPVLMGFGIFTSLFSSNLTPKLLKFSGYVIIFLGVVMLNRGLTVTGKGFDALTLKNKIVLTLSPEKLKTFFTGDVQSIAMTVREDGYIPNKFILVKGIPVKWIIDGKKLNGCNEKIIVPQFGLEILLKPGHQTIEFFPSQTGIVPWSCGMGMLQGSFVVVDRTPQPSLSEAFHAFLLRSWTRLENFIHELTISGCPVSISHSQ